MQTSLPSREHVAACLAALAKLALCGFRAPQDWIDAKAAHRAAEAMPDGVARNDAIRAALTRLNTVAVVWSSTLSDLAPEEIAAAADAYCKRGSPTGDVAAFPTTADLYALARPADHAGEADEAWGRLAELVRRHGADAPPLAPADRGPWLLHADRQIAAWMHRACERLGGWPSTHAHPTLGDAWASALAAVLDDAIRAGRETLGQTIAPARRTAVEAAVTLASSLDPVDLIPVLRAAMQAHPPDDPPVERLTGWRLDGDPAIERRMHGALAAIGGWRARCQLAADDVGPTRASWRQAYLATAARLLPREDRGELPRIGERPALRLLQGGA